MIQTCSQLATCDMIATAASIGLSMSTAEGTVPAAPTRLLAEKGGHECCRPPTRLLPAQTMASVTWIVMNDHSHACTSMLLL